MLDLGPAVLKTAAARVMYSLRLAGTDQRPRRDTARLRLFCPPRSARVGTARQGNEQKILEGVSLMRQIGVRAHTIGLIAAAAAAVSALSGWARAADEAPDIFGTFWATEYHAKIRPLGDGDLPLTADGKAAYEKNMAGLKDGSIIDTARRYCVPDGLPRVLATPYPFEIIKGPRAQVTVLHELNHQVRAIAMDKPLPSDKEMIPFPYWNGHSAGHYEGDALVIESAGFNERTFVDATGAPHTDEMRTIERVRNIGPRQIEDVITIHDPQYYTRDWQARFVYDRRDDVQLEDYVCGEPHRDLSSVAGVRRR
jgi:hypothetical protein